MRAQSTADIQTTVALSHLGQMAVLAHERLVKAVGPARAMELIQGAVAVLGKRRFDHPQDLFDIAGYLIESGGLVQVVGHSLKVHALLRGAVDF